MPKTVRLAVSATLLVLAMAATAQARPPSLGTVQPIVVAAEPVAAQAGMDVLKRGGTAADAAVAIQAMLALVEPQSSSLAGGAFMLYYDAGTGQITDYNGRETAPAGASPDMFMKDAATPMKFSEAVISGRATGVPGAIFMLDQAQKDHGKLDWNTLFGAAETQATEGFTISHRLGYDLQETDVDFAERHAPDVLSYFSDGKGGLLKEGDTLKNPAYAATLRALAIQRSDALRTGPIAEAIVAKTHEAPLPGTMTLADIANYKVGKTVGFPVAGEDFRNKPICAPYRVYIVCTNNVPSGGPALLQGLRILDARPEIAAWGVHDPRAWQLLIEAERMMYADRDQYEGDTALFAAQENTYLGSDYTRGRAAQIGVGRANPVPQPGAMPGIVGPDKTIEPGGTTHFVIRDTFGNVLSMTTTVESLFGTGRMAKGFFLNNQLTDFSFNPVTTTGAPAANAVAPGKHPRSSMSPVIVFDKTGKVVAAVGSPGGTAIIAYNLKTLVGLLDWNLSMQDAIDLPNVIARGSAIRVEKDRMEPAVWDGLTGMGYQLTAVQGEESGLNGFDVRPDGSLDSGADPRREGVAVTGK